MNLVFSQREREEMANTGVPLTFYKKLITIFIVQLIHMITIDRYHYCGYK